MKDMRTKNDRRPSRKSVPLRSLVLLPVLALSMCSIGCELLLIGGAAGAGAGAATYVTGKQVKTVDYPVPETQKAAAAALEELGLPIIQNRGDLVSAHLESEFADDKEVWIDIEATGDNNSEVSVRVGWLGDENRTNRIMDLIEDHLGSSKTKPTGDGDTEEKTNEKDSQDTNEGDGGSGGKTEQA